MPITVCIPQEPEYAAQLLESTDIQREEAALLEWERRQNDGLTDAEVQELSQGQDSRCAPAAVRSQGRRG